jgi:hypothetical protein
MNPNFQPPSYGAKQSYDIPERTNIFAKSNAKSIAVYDSVPGSTSSSPATPISPNTTDDISFGSRSSSLSPQTNFVKDFSSPNILKSSSPQTAFQTRQGPPDQIQYDSRKKSRNPLGLFLGPNDQRSFSDPSQNSPSPSPKVGRLGAAGSPQLFVNIPSSPLMPLPPFRSDYANQRGSEADITTSAAWARSRGLTIGTSAQQSAAPALKSSSSIPDLKTAVAQQLKEGSTPTATSGFPMQPPMPWMDSEGRGSVRSVRSAYTNTSNMTYESSINDDARSSFTGSFVMINKRRSTSPSQKELTVEDAIDLYADLEIDADLERALDAGIRQVESFVRSRTTTMQIDELSKAVVVTDQPVPPIAAQFLRKEAPPPPRPDPQAAGQPSNQQLPKTAPPRPARNDLEESMQADGFQPLPNMLDVGDVMDVTQPLGPTNQSGPRPTSPDVQNPLRAHPTGLGPKNPPVRTNSPTEPAVAVPRDMYGFKKESQYVNEVQYEAWNAEYSVYLERRRRKWEALMRQYGLSTENPVRFPPKSDKVKRYIRKGIPPDWRGAAWFWYAGGPDVLAREPGLYRQLIAKADNGELSEIDRESIERDLHRTFPDNIRFKPDIESQPQHSEFPGRQVGPLARDGVVRETEILGALRRVLQAFAIHNSNIGYCQSLNFLAGLLLLFLDEDEEKSFVMLNILTNYHLPGIHAKLLEANVDVGVLMSCIQESMPAVWEKIDDVEDQEQQTNIRGRARAPVGLRLPTVSLATTSWFMSCFLGNMPIESVLRIWDSLFYEGSKTLFRVSLAVFKTSENEIRTTREQLEIFQVVQGLPRRLLDINMLMEACFKRRNGFGHLSQETIDERRAWRRRLVRRERDEKDWEQLQMLQEKEAGKPIKPLDPQAVPSGQTRGRNLVDRGAAPGTPPAPLLQQLPGQEQIKRKAPPIPPPPPALMLGPVQPTSNPINLPLSPAYDMNPPIDQQRPSTADQPQSSGMQQGQLPISLTPQQQPRGRAQYAVNPMVIPPTPTQDRQRRPSFDQSSRENSDASQGPIRRAASRARAYRERSRSRKQAKQKNWTDDHWMEAN